MDLWPIAIIAGSAALITVALGARKPFNAFISSLSRRRIDVGPIALAGVAHLEQQQALPIDAQPPRIDPAALLMPPMQEETARQLVTGMRGVAAGDREMALAREATKHWYAYWFYRFYFGIYASQLGALRALHTAAGGFSDSQLRIWYATARMANGPAYDAFTFEMWRHYLENNNLIVRQGDNWFSTPLAHLFLRFIVDERLGEHGAPDRTRY